MRLGVSNCIIAATIIGLAWVTTAKASGNGLAGGAQERSSRQVVTGSCSPSRIRFKTSDVSVSTTSTLFQVVPDTRVKFRQHGTNASCVIVHYSAMAYAVDPRWIRMRVVLDHAFIAEPGLIQFDGSAVLSKVRSFDFVFPSVAPGKHDIAVHWESFNGGVVFMHKRTTLVQYR